ncbi:MAG: divergent polysaccharide deacetylase family protein [Gammaproteobacteria bacterium]
MNRFSSSIIFSLILGSGFFITADLYAQEPVIAIIIDDIGWRKQDDLRALELPGAVTYSVLPQTPNTVFMSEKAREKGKEVMLHIPMEAKKDNHLLGPGALTSNMSKEEFVATIEANFNSVPDAVGINNHMGSLLTNHKLSMHRLMNAMQRPNTPFFVDSKTSGTTLPGDVAEIYGIANTRRDVFLDNEKNAKSIRNQFYKLVKIAKQKGSALAIAHPHKETTQTLKILLADLKSYGVKLISISEFMKYRDEKNYEWKDSSLLTRVEN